MSTPTERNARLRKALHLITIVALAWYTAVHKSIAGENTADGLRQLIATLTAAQQAAEDKLLSISSSV